MKGNEVVIQKTYLKDYQPLDAKISKVDLKFDLDPAKTIVTSECTFEVKTLGREIFLNGEQLKLLSIQIDDVNLPPSDYVVSEVGLTLKNINKNNFVLKTVCEISPEKNSALEGLYQSGTILCTQNEPEGFRKITYFIDRPDNMSIYKVRITASKIKYPKLLANGNCVGSGDLEGGNHWAEWQDPFPKPSYLFALVAGDLGLVEDTYTTKSGRVIQLSIYCDIGQEPRCVFAMESLKKAMKWDEDRFDLEYDLDQYMIVSVGSFNMGAMENKGLNIFNSALVLAEQTTATDADYMAIESVIGHEYFHNWTGNRITCRDWFQLTLKEGLTVFRDQEFSADINSRDVLRIQEVNRLKEAQYSEDASPMAHPIRPDTYVQIDNFYTATVYEKGSEVIRMIHTLVGEAGFQKGMKKYFELFDGQAVTTEDFIHAMKLANPHFDSELFKNWYSQKGTPVVEINGAYDEKARIYRLSYRQVQTSKDDSGKGLAATPLLIPCKLGFINARGEEFKPSINDANQTYWNEGVVAFNWLQGEVIFENVSEAPVLSMNRSLSAPVYLKYESTLDQDLHLFRYDKDQFNRFEVGQKICTEWILDHIKKPLQRLNSKIITAFAEIVNDLSINDHMKALLLSAPTESVLHQRQNPVNFKETKNARDFFLDEMATAFEGQFLKIYNSLIISTKGAFASEKVGARALKNTSLSYLARLGEKYKDLVFQHYLTADNMTDQFKGLHLVNEFFSDQSKECNEEFYQKWKKEDLVLQKWFTLQTLGSDETIFEKICQLKALPEYDSSVPNFVRSLFGSFSRNYSMFHDESGRGYKLMANEIIEMDGINRSMAAGLAKTYRIKTSLSEHHKKLIDTELKRILDKENISSNLSEVVDQILNS